MDTKNMLISFKKWSLNFFNKNVDYFHQKFKASKNISPAEYRKNQDH